MVDLISAVIPLQLNSLRLIQESQTMLTCEYKVVPFDVGPTITTAVFVELDESVR